jgi:putative oxygen-independent coproporphyrinogen III oxidase
LADAYVEVLVTELRRSFAPGVLPDATSVFFGGGTPSMLPASDIAAIIAAIPLASGAEVTVETNPDDVTPELIAGYVDGGVNRVSMGVQSTVPHVLTALGRTHDRANVERAVTALRSSELTTFNLDLIYGAVGESFNDWQRTLADVVAYEPPHVSAYGLTVEPGTPLASDPTRHPDDDEQADKYVLADEMLAQVGLANYEISNWARPGHECRHNLLYWNQGNYLIRMAGVSGGSARPSATSSACGRGPRRMWAKKCSTAPPVGSKSSSWRCGHATVFRLER